MPSPYLNGDIPVILVGDIRLLAVQLTRADGTTFTPTVTLTITAPDGSAVVTDAATTVTGGTAAVAEYLFDTTGLASGVYKAVFKVVDGTVTQLFEELLRLAVP